MSLLFWILTGVLYGVAIVVLSHFFHFPLYITLLILIPMAMVTMIVFSVLYNSRPSLKPEDIPRKNLEKCRKDLEEREELLRTLGFDRTDEFFMRILPESIVYCFVHGEEDIFFCLYHMGSRIIGDVVSLYGGDVSLTTAMAVDAGNMPRDPRGMLQIFPDAPISTMLDRHREGVNFLMKKGYKPIRVSPEQFREMFIKSHQDAYERIKSYPFWPVMVLIWSSSESWTSCGKPISKQFEEGNIILG